MNPSPQTRPAWTINNAAAFNHWMKTGASELPADWIDDGDLPPPPITSPDDLHFLRSTSVDERGVDEIDRMLDDRTVFDPYDHHVSSRSSDEGLARILGVLDELQTEKKQS